VSSEKSPPCEHLPKFYGLCVKSRLVAASSVQGVRPGVAEESYRSAFPGRLGRLSPSSGKLFGRGLCCAEDGIPAPGQRPQGRGEPARCDSAPCCRGDSTKGSGWDGDEAQSRTLQFRITGQGRKQEHHACKYLPSLARIGIVFL
jgi:hypothetical protein